MFLLSMQQVIYIYIVTAHVPIFGVIRTITNHKGPDPFKSSMQMRTTLISAHTAIDDL